MSISRQSTCVAIGDRALLIEGASGTGKSSLALALIDRGAVLIGDDSVLLEQRNGRLFAQPHPNTRGLLEIRNLGLMDFPVGNEAPVALVVHLSMDAPRFVENAASVEICGATIPLLHLWPDSPVLHLRAERALQRYGLHVP